jgi:hypothetical protein
MKTVRIDIRTLRGADRNIIEASYNGKLLIAPTNIREDLTIPYYPWYFSKRYDPCDIDKIKEFARSIGFTHYRVYVERETRVKLDQYSGKL